MLFNAPEFNTHVFSSKRFMHYCFILIFLELQGFVRTFTPAVGWAIVVTTRESPKHIPQHVIMRKYSER